MTIGMMRRRDEMWLGRPLVVAVGRIVPYRYRRYEDIAEFRRFGAVVVVSVSIICRDDDDDYAGNLDSPTTRENPQYMPMGKSSEVPQEQESIPFLRLRFAVGMDKSFDLRPYSKLSQTCTYWWQAAQLAHLF
jgi:hypothetical protein